MIETVTSACQSLWIYISLVLYIQFRDLQFSKLKIPLSLRNTILEPEMPKTIKTNEHIHSYVKSDQNVSAYVYWIDKQSNIAQFYIR